MNDFGMRSLSEDSGNNLHHVHVETLCGTITDFLDTLDGTQHSNAELVEKRLSESEVAILECGLIVADIKNISEDIDTTYIPTLEKDKSELMNLFSTLDRISETTLPELEGDLNTIQELVNSLDMRFQDFSRAKSMNWIRKFLPSGPVISRDEHARYAHQIATCKHHTAHELLQHFDPPVSNNSKDDNDLDGASPAEDSIDFSQPL